MRRKHLLFTGLIIAILLHLCGIQTQARELTDQLGRQVILPDRPKRVVALAPSITESIFALHREDCLVGVTRFSDFPPQADHLPSVGSYISLDLEKIVALKPDLCLGTKDGNPKAVIHRLQALDIPVYVVDPRDLSAVMDTLLAIGEILNAADQARTIVSRMRSRIKAVTSRVATTTYRPRVFFQIGITPIVSVGTPTFIHQLIVMAGGENIAEGPTAYPRFSREQVLALAPDVLIITSMARGEHFQRVKNSWSKWSHLPAVQKNNLFVVESNLFDRASPRLVDALERLAQLIHPELFGETS